MVLYESLNGFPPMHVYASHRLQFLLGNDETPRTTAIHSWFSNSKLFPSAYSVEKMKTEDEKEIISLNVYL